MIINTGSRTDIPAYYSEWFCNRIKEGYVLTRNPYRKEQVLKYLLEPSVVDCINFCTKNPGPMLNRLKELEQFKQLWYVTITPYEEEIEPHVPPAEEVIESLQRLSEELGAKAVVWRYDPVFITEKYSLAFHIKSFEKMAAALTGYTHRSVISFIDLYEKTRRNFPEVREVTMGERRTIGKEFAAIGKKYDIIINSCCEGTYLKEYGIDILGCMTQKIVEQAIGSTLDVPKRKPARPDCDCLLGNDIGMYNTCGHACRYCYANYDQNIVIANMRLHNPKSPLLIGNLQPNDTVHHTKQKSWINNQLRLNL